MTETLSQFLTFSLGKEAYGIEILQVQEIKGYTTITAIPNTPDFIRGVMNLRGTVVPIVDLRLMFGMAAAEYDKFTVIIVVTVGGRVVGLVVDAVSDVLDVVPEDVERTPELGSGIDTSYLTGLAKSGEQLVMLLDISRVVSTEHLGSLAAA
ncbi:MAG: purine-binding chemotaxis protein CheW [Phycisphaerae bacterium]|nr:purine-binding chemotaxis protein CheW [Gemmatimonadaceae bacterium]